ncbi:MAG: type II secretion system F family protein [Alphaproteobacteria bacterium]|nr:type II secretion system F family protein [Alphaproteobacteria bacterium]
MLTDPVFLILVGGLVLAACLALPAFAGDGGRYKARLKRVGDTGVVRGATATTIRREAPKKGPLDHIAERWMPLGKEGRLRLERAGLSLSTGRYLAICLAAALVKASLLSLLGLPLLVGLPVSLILALTVARLTVDLLTARRQRQFLLLFPDAIDLMVRGLRSGFPVSETLTVVGKEVRDPVGEIFRLAADQIRLGSSMEQALWEAQKRIDLPDFAFFVISLSVQRETGGNLSETLNNLSDILRRRQQMKLKVRALSAEARFSAYVLGGMPFAILAALLMFNPDYVDALYTDPRGQMIAIAALTFEALGIYTMFRLARFEI